MCGISPIIHEEIEEAGPIKSGAHEEMSLLVTKAPKLNAQIFDDWNTSFTSIVGM